MDIEENKNENSENKYNLRKQKISSYKEVKYL